MSKRKISPALLAEEHWSWLETLLHKIYTDAFVHGYKHGVVSKKSGNKYLPGSKLLPGPIVGKNKI